VFTSVDTILWIIPDVNTGVSFCFAVATKFLRILRRVMSVVRLFRFSIWIFLVPTPNTNAVIPFTHLSSLSLSARSFQTQHQTMAKMPLMVAPTGEETPSPHRPIEYRKAIRWHPVKNAAASFILIPYLLGLFSEEEQIMSE